MLSRRGPLHEELSEVWSYQSDPPSRRKNIPRIFSFLKTLLKKEEGCHPLCRHAPEACAIKMHKITNSRYLFISYVYFTKCNGLLTTRHCPNTASTTRLVLTSYTLVRMTHSLDRTLLCHSTKRVWCVGKICLIVYSSALGMNMQL